MKHTAVRGNGVVLITLRMLSLATPVHGVAAFMRDTVALSAID